MKAHGKLLMAGIGMLVMILDAKHAVSAAMEGVRLCLQMVIPSLFPFLVLSAYLVGTISSVTLPFGSRLAQVLGIPQGSEGIFISGFLGGYPTGANAIAEAERNGMLTAEEGSRMLAFCNNVGPAFLFGLAASLFPEGWMAWALWLIHILSALLVGVLLPGKSNRRLEKDHGKSISFPAALFSGVKTVGLVCGWVVLFRIVIGFLERWLLWLLPDGAAVLIAGLLELTNGCCMLSRIGHLGGRFVLCSGLLAFGGLCVGMQTASVAHRLDTRLYFPGKCLQSIFSIAMAIIVQNFFSQEQRLPLWAPAVSLTIGFGAVFPGIRQKRGGNPLPIHV